jgi:hypothetical protein
MRRRPRPPYCRTVLTLTHAQETQTAVLTFTHAQETQTTVKVLLLDANDHSPQILFRYFPDQAAKFATIEENAKPGTLVTAITVTDQDKGDNGRTSLRIAEGNELGHFKLDSRYRIQ